VTDSRVAILEPIDSALIRETIVQPLSWSEPTVSPVAYVPICLVHPSEQLVLALTDPRNLG